MKRFNLCALPLLAIACSSWAAVPAGAPAGTTGLCKDGSYASSAEKKGACRGHKGVKDWYAEASSTAPPVTSAAPVATPAPAPTSAPTKASRPGPTYTPPATTAAGGGAGMVWANDSSKVYHCQSDKWYGKTKHGAYMSEPDAKAKGFHAEHGKACA